MKAGDRLRLVRWGPSELVDDNLTVPPGTEGTVTDVAKPTSLTPTGQVWVQWDNGALLALIPGHDHFEPIDGEELV